MSWFKTPTKAISVSTSPEAIPIPRSLDHTIGELSKHGEVWLYSVVWNGSVSWHCAFKMEIQGSVKVEIKANGEVRDGATPQSMANDCLRKLEMALQGRARL